MPHQPAAAPLDVKLLLLLDELHRTRSVTRAAERLGLSQPTISIWLGRLRRQLRDPLFVRAAAGMEPTARADALIGPAREALALLRRLADREPAFDAASERRDFRICMTDASHISLLPRLLAHVRATAPGVRLEVAPIDETTARALAAGEADLALGFIPGLESGFYQRSLFTQDFVCLVNARHPRIGKTLTLRAYKDEGHIGILSGASYATIDSALKKQRIRRRVLLELPGFLGLAAIVSTADLIATVPHNIGETLAETGGLRLLPCPVKIPSFTVKQHWHARHHHDPANRWLRDACAALFSQGGPRGRSGRAQLEADERR